MSIPPYPEANSFGTLDGQPAGTRVPIKYIWPKRIAVILAGLAVVGGIGFGVKALLPSDDSASTSRETVQSASQAPAPTQAPESPAPAASQAPTAPMTGRGIGAAQRLRGRRGDGEGIPLPTGRVAFRAVFFRRFETSVRGGFRRFRGLEGCGGGDEGQKAAEGSFHRVVGVGVSALLSAEEASAGA